MQRIVIILFNKCQIHKYYLLILTIYTTKFVPQSISSSSDFSSATWLMTALSPGTDDIVDQSGVTIAAPDASFTHPAVGIYISQTATYKVEIASGMMHEIVDSLLNKRINLYQY